MRKPVPIALGIVLHWLNPPSFKRPPTPPGRRLLTRPRPAAGPVPCRPPPSAPASRLPPLQALRLRTASSRCWEQGTFAEIWLKCSIIRKREEGKKKKEVCLNFFFNLKGMKIQTAKICGMLRGKFTAFYAHFRKGLARLCLVTQSRPTLCDPWTAACQVSLSITNTRKVPTSRTSKKKNKINPKQVDGRSKWRQEQKPEIFKKETNRINGTKSIGKTSNVIKLLARKKREREREDRLVVSGINSQFLETHTAVTQPIRNN